MLHSPYFLDPYCLDSVGAYCSQHLMIAVLRYFTVHWYIPTFECQHKKLLQSSMYCLVKFLNVESELSEMTPPKKCRRPRPETSRTSPLPIHNQLLLSSRNLQRHKYKITTTQFNKSQITLNKKMKLQVFVKVKQFKI